MSELKSTEVKMAFDPVAYKKNKDSLYVELNYQIEKQTLNYSQIDGKNAAILIFQTMIIDKKDTLSEIWETQIIKEGVEDNILISSRLYEIENKSQKIINRVFDKKTNNLIYSVENDIDKKNYDFKISISDPLICYDICPFEKGVNSEIFKKFDIYAPPNPSNEILGTEPEIKYYYEIYPNCEFDSIRLTKTVKDAGKRIVIIMNSTKTPNIKYNYEYGFIPLDSLASGVYYYEVKAELFKNGEIQDIDNKIKKLYLVNPNMKPDFDNNFTEDQLFAMSEFSSLTDEQTDVEYGYANIIADKNEIDVWNQLSEYTAKRHYLFAFWKKRDVDTNKYVNEYREEIKGYIKEANTYYSKSINDGWKTDRGRILIKYGKPTDKDIHTADEGNKPYEEWFYAGKEGGIRFYFVDVNSNNNYKLVHSTSINEIRNDNWQMQYLRINK
jgi:GWxTD domain-containing protein